MGRRKFVSGVILICLTSFIAAAAGSCIRAGGMKRIMVLLGKTACNTFCPGAFYEKPLYYYDENTHPAVLVFGNIFPVVRLMAAGAVDAPVDTVAMSTNIPGHKAYIEVLEGNAENSENGEKGTEAFGGAAEGAESGSGAGDESNAGGSTNNISDTDYGTGNNTKNNTVNDTENNTENHGSGEHAGTGNDSEEASESSKKEENARETIKNVSASLPYSYDKLISYEFVHDSFYVIPSHTALSEELLKPEEFLSTDLSVKDKNPCILIYHTHSQEAFADSRGDDMTIVQVGDYLEQLLKERYGYEVMHVTTEFDMLDGSLDRGKAYTYAQLEIGKIIEEHPEIDMVIDLHRDGVKESLHFVTEINGKPTARLMLFNGISYSKNQGNIDYLYNPYIKENLALTYQLYLLGKVYYPDFFRCIYIEAYRYNLHLCKRSMLIEAGAQTNSFEEVKNAMEPLSELIARELEGESVLR